METIRDSSFSPETQKWHWHQVRADLIQQGGLEDRDIMIDPLTVNEAGCGGRYQEKPFYITWARDRFLLLSAEQHIPQLVDAFAKVVEYRPFVKYREPDSGLVTVEWDKLDPEGRFRELQGEGKLNITRI